MAAGLTRSNRQHPRYHPDCHEHGTREKDETTARDAFIGATGNSWSDETATLMTTER